MNIEKRLQELKSQKHIQEKISAEITALESYIHYKKSAKDDLKTAREFKAKYKVLRKENNEYKR